MLSEYLLRETNRRSVGTRSVVIRATNGLTIDESFVMHESIKVKGVRVDNGRRVKTLPIILKIIIIVAEKAKYNDCLLEELVSGDGAEAARWRGRRWRR